MPIYQPRFVRRAQPPRLVLTPRDEEIVLACYSYRWLTRPQLQQVVPLGCVTRSNARLRGLYDWGFLGRSAVGTVGAGLQPVYTAGEAAIPLVAARLETEEKAVRERVREDARASAILLPHDLQGNDVRLTLTRIIRQDPGLALETWLNAAECYDPYTPNRRLRPDGYFRFFAGSVCHANFLEIDRGTVSLARFAEKCTRYEEYRDRGAYTDRYGLSRFRVLTTAPTWERLENLLAATQEVAARGFWFALSGDVLGLDDLAAPIWRLPGQRQGRGLISAEGAA
jgi:hypothetical protein